MEQPRNAEEALAGLLNGVMFTLLGGAGPGILAWQAFTDWPAFTSGLHAMTAQEAMQGFTLLAFGLPVASFGVRLFWRNITFLRSR